MTAGDQSSSSSSVVDDADDGAEVADVRAEMYRLEKNRMRSPSEGKACLDRYVYVR